jgi:hypothetical protein
LVFVEIDTTRLQFYFSRILFFRASNSPIETIKFEIFFEDTAWKAEWEGTGCIEYQKRPFRAI